VRRCRLRVASRASQVRDEMDRILEMRADAGDFVPPPHLAKFLLDGDLQPRLGALNADPSSQELVLYLQAREKRRQQMLDEERQTRQSLYTPVDSPRFTGTSTGAEKSFFDDLHKLVLDYECLRRTHDDCKLDLRRLEHDNQALRSENVRLKQRCSAQEHRLRKCEKDSKWMQSQVGSLFCAQRHWKGLVHSI